MFSDLRDGRKLLDLLEGLTGTVLVSLNIFFLELGYMSFKVPEDMISFNI